MMFDARSQSMTYTNIKPVKARQAQFVPGMTWVLTISIALAIVAMALALVGVM